MESVRRAQGCWTCKKRKIGCDRGEPFCNNCIRTGRECLGYGLRLAWPDQPDGRRRVNRLPEQEIRSPSTNSEYYGKQFLNVTYADLALAGSGSPPDGLAVMRSGIARPKRLISFIPNVHERESYLITYYEGRLARMISTIDVNNGFRDELLPMAMSNLSPASDGLRNAMLALAAFHLWGPEQALPYKAMALRSLYSSLSSDSVGITETQLATSMMLCVYNVFDETEGNWYLHLNGAKNILCQLAGVRGSLLKYGFLYTWFLYHEILGCFVDPLRQGKDGPASIRLRRDMLFDPSIIVGSLGCSVEVMEIISYVNGLRAIELKGESAAFSPGEQLCRNEEWHSIESRLSNLNQRLDPESETKLPTQERTRIRTTAELYRIATFLYLQRTINNAQVQETRTVYLEQAFRVLGSMAVCTSPWPLFIIACETESDAQRIVILQTLDRMDEERHIGNVFVLRNIIESFWKQQDLQVDSGRACNIKWWDVVDLNTVAPWFI
ncbi:fungal-specific transcription factor domain-containing protein [Pseudomassariella vexata]|uniref:Fungal-specific transcription factor domain-domain-containing protein n=1 Tax=Pseudomassariella vexata TaxID=1141098 RepID=A0A1Y2EBY2_9PEZI|nr:fungal-specific transcription factor domain-containing protein [Pseudomassariella vexata]ORY68814.1 fungal-specific transcription factor domain-domain-containing protein [Pseudomassariella vexata]